MTKIFVKLTLMLAALFSTAQAADDIRDLFNQAQTTLRHYTETYSSAHVMSLTQRRQTELERDFSPWTLQNDITYGNSFKKISKAISAATRAPLARICQVFAITAADFRNAIHLIESRMPELTHQKQIIQAAFEAQMRQDAEQRAWLLEIAREQANSGFDHWRSSK